MVIFGANTAYVANVLKEIRILIKYWQLNVTVEKIMQFIKNISTNATVVKIMILKIFERNANVTEILNFLEKI